LVCWTVGKSHPPQKPKPSLKRGERLEIVMSTLSITRDATDCSILINLINTGWFTASILLLGGVLCLQLEWMNAGWVPTRSDYTFSLLCGLYIVAAFVAILWLNRFPRSHSTMFAALISIFLLTLASVCLIIIDYRNRSSVLTLGETVLLFFSPAPLWFQVLRTEILLLPLAMWILRPSHLWTQIGRIIQKVTPYEKVMEKGGFFLERSRSHLLSRSTRGQK
jgi:hypothetical protein